MSCAYLFRHGRLHGVSSLAQQKTGENFLKPTTGKYLHYYFYFIDENFGLCYLRLPTWAPFRLQVYFNGHFWLVRHLDRSGND